jgi:hypothetical protein
MGWKTNFLIIFLSITVLLIVGAVIGAVMQKKKMIDLGFGNVTIDKLDEKMKKDLINVKNAIANFTKKIGGNEAFGALKPPRKVKF